jgi:protein-tyrosine kinase
LSFIDKALEKAKARQKKEVRQTVPPKPERLPADTPLVSSAALPEQEIIPSEIEYTITRTVAVDPEVMRQNRLIAGGGEVEAAAAEEYKLLRTHILQRTRGESRNTLMITGPRPGEGKTLTAINLAISISHEVNQTVLLVDADLRSPSVHRCFGIPRGEGLIDHLTRGVPLSELLVHPQGLGKLVILPGGKPATKAAELVSSPTMAELVQELKHFYPNRYVIFDLPPLLTYADALAFAPSVDGIIVVVEAGKSSREDIERCQEMLKKFNLLGFVLNKTEVEDTSHYYYGDKRAEKGKFKFPQFKSGNPSRNLRA